MSWKPPCAASRAVAKASRNARENLTVVADLPDPILFFGGTWVLGVVLRFVLVVGALAKVGSLRAIGRGACCAVVARQGVDIV